MVSLCGGIALTRLSRQAARTPWCAYFSVIRRAYDSCHLPSLCARSALHDSVLRGSGTVHRLDAGAGSVASGQTITAIWDSDRNLCPVDLERALAVVPFSNTGGPPACRRAPCAQCEQAGPKDSPRSPRGNTRAPLLLPSYAGSGLLRGTRDSRCTQCGSRRCCTLS